MSPLLLLTSVLIILKLRSSMYLTISLAIGLAKLGQPQPDENLSVEVKSGSLVAMST